MSELTVEQIAAEIQRRIELANLLEAHQTRPEAPPSWASFFTGYRDALNELLEMVKDKQ